MPPEFNQKIVMKSRPDGYPKLSDFELITAPIPEPGEGEILIKSLWLSLDPYMRGRMNAGSGYAASQELDEVMVGAVVGRVLKSRTPAFAVGDLVEGPLGWQEYGISDGRNLRRVDSDLGPLSTAVGVLGMPGLTAYFGLLTVGNPKPGDTVVVSAASGAVGQVVGQIAKILGCRFVGTAGSQEKVDFIVNELGFDVGINYKTGNLTQALAEACPQGIDVYFENVGGDMFDAVINNLADFARIAVCGVISQYNANQPVLCPRNTQMLVRHRARMEGFLVFEFANRYEHGRQRLANWIKEGKLIYKEDIVEGIEKAPEAFIGMLSGANFGKLVIRVADDD